MPYMGVLARVERRGTRFARRGEAVLNDEGGGDRGDDEIRTTNLVGAVVRCARIAERVATE